MKKRLRIGTRGSDLALVQADITAQLLKKAHPELALERVIIKTTGDRHTDLPLREVAKSESNKKSQANHTPERGIFIKELETSLQENKIDLAVHSLKDLPSELEPSFILPAILKREDVRDILITHKAFPLKGTGHGQLIATSSVRRIEFLRHLYPQIRTCDLRGNVPTRLEKISANITIHGTLLAAAGLKRLGYPLEGNFTVGNNQLTATPLNPAIFLPAAGQGAIGLECRSHDTHTIELLKKINDPQTEIAVTAERAFLKYLQAGCHTPVGIFSTINGDKLHLTASVFNEETPGQAPRQSHAIGSTSTPADLALQLYQTLK